MVPHSDLEAFTLKTFPAASYETLLSANHRRPYLRRLYPCILIITPTRCTNLSNLFLQ